MAAASTAPLTTETAGERRHVTVMFCDLVDSTGIASKLDAEEWRDLVGAFRADGRLTALLKLDGAGGSGRSPHSRMWVRSPMAAHRGLAAKCPTDGFIESLARSAQIGPQPASGLSGES
jgi:hypothetical protein